MRDLARKIHEEANLNFIEVYVSTSIEVCEKRDIKGLYKKARSGELKNFTGVSDLYEPPLNPDLNLDTEELNLDDCVLAICNKISKEGKFFQKVLNQSQKISELKTEYKSDSYEIVVNEEELNWLQTMQQGWCPPGLKCFMNEEQLLETIYFQTFT
jgi:3'-phosphoadenosine 5'-phosphosulfate synthase